MRRRSEEEEVRSRAQGRWHAGAAARHTWRLYSAFVVYVRRCYCGEIPFVYSSVCQCAASSLSCSRDTCELMSSLYRAMREQSQRERRRPGRRGDGTQTATAEAGGCAFEFCGFFMSATAHR